MNGEWRQVHGSGQVRAEGMSADVTGVRVSSVGPFKVILLDSRFSADRLV